MMAPGIVGGTRMAVAGLDELGMQTVGESLRVSLLGEWVACVRL